MAVQQLRDTCPSKMRAHARIGLRQSFAVPGLDVRIGAVADQELGYLWEVLHGLQCAMSHVCSCRSSKIHTRV